LVSSRALGPAIWSTKPIDKNTQSPMPRQNTCSTWNFARCGKAAKVSAEFVAGHM
jgi:hypothetical protein